MDLTEINFKCHDLMLTLYFSLKPHWILGLFRKVPPHGPELEVRSDFKGRIYIIYCIYLHTLLLRS